MKWQKVLTKTQMKHVRWALNGYATLERFKVSREKQVKLTKQRNDAGLGGDICHECSMIEARLKEAGKL